MPRRRCRVVLRPGGRAASRAGAKGKGSQGDLRRLPGSPRLPVVRVEGGHPRRNLGRPDRGRASQAAQEPCPATQRGLGIKAGRVPEIRGLSWNPGTGVLSPGCRSELVVCRPRSGGCGTTGRCPSTLARSHARPGTRAPGCHLGVGPVHAVDRAREVVQLSEPSLHALDRWAALSPSLQGTNATARSSPGPWA